MAPKAGQIKARTRTAEFEIEGDDWEISYRPFSQNLLKEVTQGDDNEQLDGLVGLLERVIVDWNLTDDDDKPMPFDADWLRGVGLDYVRMILEGLMEDMQTKKAPSTPSSARLALVATA